MLASTETGGFSPGMRRSYLHAKELASLVCLQKRDVKVDASSSDTGSTGSTLPGASDPIYLIFFPLSAGTRQECNMSMQTGKQSMYMDTIRSESGLLHMWKLNGCDTRDILRRCKSYGIKNADASFSEGSLLSPPP